MCCCLLTQLVFTCQKPWKSVFTILVPSILVFPKVNSKWIIWSIFSKYRTVEELIDFYYFLLSINQPTPAPHAVCSFLGKYRGRPPKFEASEVDGEGRVWYACSVCSLKFEVRSELMQHMRTHNRERPFHCKICGLNFKQVPYLILCMPPPPILSLPVKCQIFRVKGAQSWEFWLRVSYTIKAFLGC